MHTSNNEIRRVNNVGPLQPGKEIKNKLSTARSDKHGNKYVQHHIHGEKNICERKLRQQMLLNKSEGGYGPGQLECDVVQGDS